ncbi:hypothetical protein [Paenibacillus sp. CF384]|uniref:hypothetical protein n=1 Tax=Paenibacillus sp. CF384 TaxID=1884382 RepID=UPI000896FA09|nr:hypothetical protein [Paenibacillus sp. CF384]SDW08451.1 hypothetical protein SAMN05518855_1001208 [Paenibacillus sp. CF384]
MKKITYIFWLASTLSFLITSVVLLECLLQQNKPLYDQIGKAISKSDSGYIEIIDLHTDSARTVAFYRSETELSVVLLKKKFRGYECSEYINKAPLLTEQEISWQGSEKKESNIHLLYGIVKDPEITQILLISEGDKTASIIKNGDYSIWYSLVENELNMPITLQATNKEGKVLYEYGDLDYWKR